MFNSLMAIRDESQGSRMLSGIPGKATRGPENIFRRMHVICIEGRRAQKKGLP
jgi:hypothetical protein